MGKLKLEALQSQNGLCEVPGVSVAVPDLGCRGWRP